METNLWTFLIIRVLTGVGHFTLDIRAPIMHWIENWVGLRIRNLITVVQFIAGYVTGRWQ
jgi:hypothetical protein